MTEPVVLDQDGSVHDLAWLRTTFQCAHLKYLEGAGLPAFRLKKIIITEGPTIIRIACLNPQGQAQFGQPVAYTFPSLTSPYFDLTPIPLGTNKSDWCRAARIARINSSGVHEFEIGEDSWIKEQRGPYSAFVISPSTYSDCLDGFGWLGGTNHRGPCELVFQLVAGSDPEPEPEPEPEGNLKETNALLRELLVEAKAIRAIFRA